MTDQSPSFTLSYGLPETLRPAAVELYWQAFGGKLGGILGPETRARALLARVMRADHVVIAQDENGKLVGIAGFKSHAGSFAGGEPADLRAIYGRFGAGWRIPILWLLSREVDNARFLVDGICVERRSRGKGIGTALLKALCAEAQRRGYGAIRLDVIDSNWRARALYERHGFMTIGTSDMGLLRHIFGFRTSITMVRPLKHPASGASAP